MKIIVTILAFSLSAIIASASARTIELTESVENAITEHVKERCYNLPFGASFEAIKIQKIVQLTDGLIVDSKLIYGDDDFTYEDQNVFYIKKVEKALKVKAVDGICAAKK